MGEGGGGGGAERAMALTVCAEAARGRTLSDSTALALAEVASVVGVALHEARTPGALGTASTLLGAMDAELQGAAAALRDQMEVEGDGGVGGSGGVEALGVSLRQPFSLRSAYGTHYEPTHAVLHYQNALDWICFDDARLEVRGVAPLPPREELVRDGAMPSAEWPSDHVALVADLAWRE
jgi:2',5'-phosphodiesterase